jgi:hypothetical protein
LRARVQLRSHAAHNARRGTGALGRPVGTKKDKKASKYPARPGKDRVKERHSIKVEPERHVPEPKGEGGKPSPKAKLAKKRPSRSQSSRNPDEVLKNLTGDDFPRTRRYPRVKCSRKKLIYQKMDLANEPWNLLRSPSLKRLKKSLAQVKKGNNPFYKFKDQLREVKIRTLGRYNRLMSALSGGLLFTAYPIGCWVTPCIRKVRKLSFRDLEILVSKLPFWATSYRPATLHRVVNIVEETMASSGNLRNSFVKNNAEANCLRAPVLCVVRTNTRANRHGVGGRLQASF